MASQETHSWTLGGLIGAFIDLVLAYFLLCCSAFVFFVSKWFRIVGLLLPCPCKGSFGYRNNRFCVHKLLFEWPSRKICSIQVMAIKRFPFDLVWVHGHSCCANDKVVAERTHYRRVVELEGEASCSSCSSPRFPPLVHRENACNAKGKTTMSMKRRSGIRRWRRGSSDPGKVSSAVPLDNLQSDVLTPLSPFDDSVVRDKTNATTSPTSGKGVSIVAEDDQTCHDLDEKTCHSYEFNGSMVDSPGQDKRLLTLEHYMDNVCDNVQIDRNEDRLKMLENALEEEKAAYTALYLELEKERASSATAADETMAMILRLQEQKASMEMEMRQYQRIIEERVAYDEEEMEILQELLIRRERENHFLEEELEAYRQMDSKGSDQSYGKAMMQCDQGGQMPPISVETNEDQNNISCSKAMVQREQCGQMAPISVETYEGRSTVSFFKKDEITDISSSYMVAQTSISSEDGEEVERNTERKAQMNDKLRRFFYDTDPDVLDAHVIEDNIEQREEENEKLSTSSLCSVTSEFTNRYFEYGSLKVRSSDAFRSCRRINKIENGNIVDGPSCSSQLSNSRCNSLTYYYGSDSSSVVENEKLRIGNEIEILGERLRKVKHGKKKLSSFQENGENLKGQLKLLEDIANNLKKIKHMRSHARGASLPPSSSKVSLRKRRSQSVGLETGESS
ncbi:myosin-binding protein 7 isoform X2 [Vigna radiata var. radiata]|uniref:Myosin-binding protein 7 isoform X2 n=1 Tax=Vigna radiata var. radiata TaxID=3916 RepID=A0A1S3VE75_VIGRR|nr:myosin-binding protein 7 isoform X2 [Vigna radiata var. radiata]